MTHGEDGVFEDFSLQAPSSAISAVGHTKYTSVGFTLGARKVALQMERLSCSFDSSVWS